MDTSDGNNASTHSLQNWFDTLSARLREQQAAELAKTQKLSPKERAVEAARKRAVDESRRVKARLLAMGDTVTKRESWTIDNFCWLLLGEDPDFDSCSLDAPGMRARTQHRQLKAVLTSCVPTFLAPMNPSEATELQRFTRDQLLAIAQEKRLGHIRELTCLLHPSGLAKVVPSATVSIEPRKSDRSRRRQDLLTVAKDLARQGSGTAHAERITLSICGKELNRELRRRHPEWNHTGDKTLEADRTACRPRIEVRTGRPPDRSQSGRP
jgi:hypothetical protein